MSQKFTLLELVPFPEGSDELLLVRGGSPKRATVESVSSTPKAVNAAIEALALKNATQALRNEASGFLDGTQQLYHATHDFMLQSQTAAQEVESDRQAVVALKGENQALHDATAALKNQTQQLHDATSATAQQVGAVAQEVEADRAAAEISKNSSAGSATAAQLSHNSALTQANRAEQERIAAQQARTAAEAAEAGALGAQSAVEAAGVNPPIRLNPNVIAADFTVPANYNALSVGPMRIADGVTVSISTGSTWSIT